MKLPATRHASSSVVFRIAPFAKGQHHASRFPFDGGSIWIGPQDRDAEAAAVLSSVGRRAVTQSSPAGVRVSHLRARPDS
jgi:hypothetical protein